MKKQGLIIAAYPGMGQEVFASINDAYLVMGARNETYQKTAATPVWAYVDYAEDAMKLVSDTGRYDVCFIEPHEDVLNYLNTIGYNTYIIAYPGCSKDSVLRTIASMYMRNPSTELGMALADVAIHFDRDVAALRKYPNSIMFKGGLINNDLLTQLVNMEPIDRKKVIQALSVIKENQTLVEEFKKDAQQYN